MIGLRALPHLSKAEVQVGASKGTEWQILQAKNMKIVLSIQTLNSKEKHEAYTIKGSVPSKYIVLLRVSAIAPNVLP